VFSPDPRAYARAVVDSREISRRTPTADVEQAILRAATELLTEKGPGALTVRGICGRAGVAPMSLYARFSGKNEVVEALFIEGFDELASAFTDIDRSAPLVALREACLRYRAHALSHRTRYAIMFDRSIPDFVPSDEARLHAFGSFHRLVDIVEIGIASGQVTPGNPSEIAQRVWSACHGAVSLELREVGFVDDRDAHYEALVDTLVRGLTA
jgi:AcrR family transcriptional regulator